MMDVVDGVTTLVPVDCTLPDWRKHLWRGRLGSTAQRPRALPEPQHARIAKVYEFQVPVAAYQYVLLAQITIHYIMLGVQVLEREDKLCSIKAGDIFAGAVRCAVVGVRALLHAVRATAPRRRVCHCG